MVDLEYLREIVQRTFVKLLPRKKKPDYDESRKDWKLHFFLTWLSSSPLFRIAVMVTIVTDAMVLVLELYTLTSSTHIPYQLLNSVFVSIYIAEFLMKFYVDPKAYLKDRYHILDLGILVLSMVEVVLTFWRMSSGASVEVLSILTIVRSLRILRLISFIKGLQVLVQALAFTFVKSILPFLGLLVVLLFVFGVFGYYLYGYRYTGDAERWGTLGRSMLSLLTFVTIDGWIEIQNRLLEHGFKTSPIFTVSFILVGHLLFTNLFIGIIVSNIHRATTIKNKMEKESRRNSIKKRMAEITQHQHNDILRLVDRQIKDNFINLHEMTKEFQKTLRHDDFIYSTDLCTSKRWIETFMASLIHLENSKYRIKNIHSDLSVCLKEKVLEMEESS